MSEEPWTVYTLTVTDLRGKSIKIGHVQLPHLKEGFLIWNEGLVIKGMTLRELTGFRWEPVNP